MTKPKKVLTVVRTGAGDQGTTWFRENRKYPKSQLQIAYLGMLDLAQSHAPGMYTIQDLLFALGAHFYNPNEDKYYNQVVDLTKYFELEVESLASRLEALDGFIRTTEGNAEMMKLRAVVRQAEQLACQLLDQELCIELHVKSLNVLSDYVFVLSWIETIQANWRENPRQKGKLDTWTGEIYNRDIVDTRLRDGATI